MKFKFTKKWCTKAADLEHGHVVAAGKPDPKTKPYKGSKPYRIQWTLKDSRAAQKQGWDLFDAGARFEIEVVTEHPAGFGEGADDAAVAWVIQQALRGNKTCIKGLLIAGLLDPQWFASDLTHAVKTRRITVMDTRDKESKPYSTVEYRET